MATIDLKTGNEDYNKYLDDFKKFYSLKQKYTTYKDTIKNKIINSDNSLDAKKKLFSKQKIKCINCGQHGGTFFLETDTMLKATCGSTTNSCNLMLEIRKMSCKQLYNEFENINNLLNIAKKNIIITKLDFLFNYIEEDKAVENFDNYKQELSNLQEKYNNLFTLYNSITNNQEIQNLINDKLLEHHNLVNEYKEYMDLFKKTSEKNYLRDALELYLSKIKNLDNDIMITKYKHNHIENNSDSNTIKLIQDKYNISDLEFINKSE